MTVFRIVLWFVTLLLLGMPEVSLAYVGPGAGFAVMTSFFAFFISFLLALLSLFFWPIRLLRRVFKKRKLTGKQLAKRVVILGFDGMDAELTRRWMEEGKLPHMKRLRETGDFRPLATTFPAVSPVAWSTFSTGVNPGKHNIFDFLTRDTNTNLPLLSSTEILPPARTISIWGYRIPLGKPALKLLRKSKSFWKILGENGIFSAILRVPVTFPPEKFFGVMLSGMCVPDLYGTQGSFTCFASDDTVLPEGFEGRLVILKKEAGEYRGSIPGPVHPLKATGHELSTDIRISTAGDGHADIFIGKTGHRIECQEPSGWISIPFRFGPGLSVRGNAQFFVSELSPALRVYMSPINIDPLKPVMPISYPQIFSGFLALRQGAFATLGLAEDTWALNEGALGEAAFLRQVGRIHEERLQMFWSVFNSVREGVVACVFDATDRTQHMFMRYLDPAHPNHPGIRNESGESAIENCYRKMDGLVGEVLERMEDDAILFVMSDHGFKSFRRGFQLNSWLRKEGYLTSPEGAEDRDWFAAVDWTRTRAYGLGLTGLYVNQRNRESLGIVAAGEEKEQLLEEIRGKLLAVTDDKDGKPVFLNIYRTSKIYSGPYAGNAPDLILGYNEGYRVSWDSVTGRTRGEILQDNMKSWSGDHCIDPVSVPGILFCNRKIASSNAGIEDMAPTVLSVFGIPRPAFMDGKSLFS